VKSEVDADFLYFFPPSFTAYIIRLLVVDVLLDLLLLLDLCMQWFPILISDGCISGESKTGFGLIGLVFCVVVENISKSISPSNVPGAASLSTVSCLQELLAAFHRSFSLPISADSYNDYLRCKKSA
jgi:hypothetical protein